jgi:endonuclease YncB( thermonuclease family)
MNPRICLLVSLAVTGLFAVAPLLADAPSTTDFQSELNSILERGIESKRGIIFHMNGEEIAGVVKRILNDAVLVANQEHATILIRLDRIDAVELD